METLLKGVKETKIGVDQKLGQQLNAKEKLLDKRQEQVTLHQQYLALVNKLQELLKKNDILSQKMEMSQK